MIQKFISGQMCIGQPTVRRGVSVQQPRPETLIACRPSLFLSYNLLSLVVVRATDCVRRVYACTSMTHAGRVV